MPLDPAFAGRVYPPTDPYEVEREKIREFALAIGEGHPAHHDPRAARALGHRDLVAPPTFLSVLMQRATDPVVLDPEIGLDYSRVVHRDQRFVFGRPVCAGDVLRLVVHIDGVRSLAGSDVLELRAEAEDVTGGRVATIHMSLVARAA
ncbi:MaoC family dehydratase N-terminal domain-containing protein [Streptomyces sp. NPDC005892]|uniref:MaoC family dehydratase N-terminal domain-containing protein n=1 Tax=Streptomyces sp. NPDC005892 TaxID=3155593 RepID=UPI0033CF7D16